MATTQSCRCGAIMRRSETATAGGNRKILFECTHCNHAESELLSRGGALIRWRNLVQTRGEKNEPINVALSACAGVSGADEPSVRNEPSDADAEAWRFAFHSD